VRQPRSNDKGKEGRNVKELLKGFVGKTLRIYTISGVESYLGILEKVENDYLVLKSFFKEDKTYVALQYVESFKEETKQ
jgi:ferredoxin-fold anticodon binding domain-containing protein